MNTLLVVAALTCFQYQEQLEIDHCTMTEVTFCGANECRNNEEYTEHMKSTVRGLDIDVAFYQLRNCTFKREKKCVLEGKSQEI